MARTTQMRLVELMIYREDLHQVLKYLGKMGQFQFQDKLETPPDGEKLNPEKDIFNRLEKARADLSIPDIQEYMGEIDIPTPEDEDEAMQIIAEVEEIHDRELNAAEELKKTDQAMTEALAFSNLKISYSELESLSFLTMRIGKIPPENFDYLQASIGNRATVVRLGEDKSRILVACSKKARFAVDTELKKNDFVEIQVPKDFKGIPEDALISLKKQKLEAEKALEEIQTERKNYAHTHKDHLIRLLELFSVDSQIYDIQNKLESTEFVYRINGWVPECLTGKMGQDLSSLTENRIGIRLYRPEEVAAVAAGAEQVPVQLRHGKIVSAFERMIFSYGSPLYGTIDPTPFVAVFFTLLFGIMFGDAGQGLVFLLVGILMAAKKLKFGGWEKFAPVFMAIGISSTIMGLLTGEFFANEEILVPFSRWVTGLFGQPRNQILPMMPTGSSESIKRMFIFFGFTVGVGFIINSCGLVINIINQFSLHRPGKAIFGKTGITGTVFFWYVIVFALRIAFFHHSPALYDWIIIGVTLLLTAFGEPLARALEKERPVLENGLFSAIISGIVEIIEVISSYLSNSVSFLRVGAFALSHEVLGYIIEKMSGLAPLAGGIAISIVGNAIVIVLEGMIVAIQVIRLQYYEFFSKFFNETGREFKPFAFKYNALKS